MLKICVTDEELSTLKQKRRKKECILVTSMPYNAGDLTDQMIDILKSHFISYPQSWNLKACSSREIPRDPYTSKTRILLGRTRRWWEGIATPNNTKPMFINERLQERGNSTKSMRSPESWKAPPLSLHWTCWSKNANAKWPRTVIPDPPPTSIAKS